MPRISDARYVKQVFSLIERAPRKAVFAGAAVAALIVLLLYIQGFGGRKVRPGVVALPAGGEAHNVATVEKREVPDAIDWPATVRSRTVANIAPKVMARVLEVRVTVGSAVRQGDLLAVLDDRDIKARAQQAQGALAAVEAQAAQADADLRRAQALFRKQASTQQELDSVEARAKSTRAQVAQARDALKEAQVALGDASMRAPFDGVVAERFVDPGDMAAPGKPVVVMYAPGSLRLETHVSEHCVGMLSVGMDVPARVDTPVLESVAHIEEIAPAADPQSRTFLVKASLSALPRLRPGTFGSLRAPCGTHPALLIPPAAVIRSGQLESVRLMVDGTVRTRNVRTGKTYNDRVEVLSGLQEGERVLIGEKTAASE
jgi:RND family efflux transporter MFP subunit